MKKRLPLTANFVAALAPDATITMSLSQFVELSERTFNADRLRREKTRRFFNAILGKCRDLLQENKTISANQLVEFIDLKWELAFDEDSPPIYDPNEEGQRTIIAQW